MRKNLILVTGATSQLLSGILPKLLNTREVSDVFCLTRSPKEKNDRFFNLMQLDCSLKTIRDILNGARFLDRITIVIAHRARENESSTESIYKELSNLKEILLEIVNFKLTHEKNNFI